MKSRAAVSIPLSLLVASSFAVSVGCKSGGEGSTSGGGVPFEAQPKHGEIDFILAAGAAVAQTSVAFSDATNGSDAGFFESTDAGAPASCEPVVLGACVVTSCVQGAPIGGAYVESTAPTGNITITDLADNASQVFASGANGYSYPGEDSIGAHAGDTVQFTTAGGEVPAFSQSLVIPVAITPAPVHCQDGSVDASTCTLSRSADLPVSWTGGSTGSVVVTLSANGAGCNNAQSCPTLQSNATCTFDLGAGTGVIPKEVLQRFAEPSVGIQFAAENIAVLDQGGYVIRVATIAQSDYGTSYALSL